jgi:hypothetical protein
MTEWHVWPGDIYPKDNEDVLVTVDGPLGRFVKATIFTSPTAGLFACEMVFACEVVAWMPFPEKYQGDQ